MRIIVAAGPAAAGVAIGDSIAINGCCLTAVAVDGDLLAFQAGEETLRCTNLARLRTGSLVNVEAAMVLGERLGGHLMTGHIDGIGSLDERRDDGEWSAYWFRALRDLMRQIVPKGSIAVDGVSLTVVNVEPERFSVALIPHTLAATTLGTLAVGEPVNLETDLIAKYVARQMTGIV